jgi:hypothetical protein
MYRCTLYVRCFVGALHEYSVECCMRVAWGSDVRVSAPIRGPFDDDRIRGLLKVTGQMIALLLMVG